MERTGTSSPRHTRTRRISGQHVIGQAPRGRRPAHLIVVRRKEVRSPDTFAPSCTRAQSKSVVSTPLEVDAIQVSARWWPGKLDVVVRQLARVSCVASRGIFRIPERPIRAAILSSERNGEMKMALCFAFFERMTPGHGGFSAPCFGNWDEGPAGIWMYVSLAWCLSRAILARSACSASNSRDHVGRDGETADSQPGSGIQHDSPVAALQRALRPLTRRSQRTPTFHGELHAPKQGSSARFLEKGIRGFSCSGGTACLSSSSSGGTMTGAYGYR